MHNLTNLSITKPHLFSDQETFGLGASPSGNEFSTIAEDLVTEVPSIERSRGGPMRCG